MVQYAMPERGTLKSLSAQPPSPNDSLSRSPRYRNLPNIINIIQFRASIYNVLFAFCFLLFISFFRSYSRFTDDYVSCHVFFVFSEVYRQRLSRAIETKKQV